MELGGLQQVLFPLGLTSASAKSMMAQAQADDCGGEVLQKDG